MKSSNIMTWLILIAIGLAGIVLFSRSQPAPKQTTVAQSAASASEFDFGKISMAKGKVTHKFELRNETQKPITLEKIYTSCMCTTALLSYKDKVLGPFGMPGHGMMPKINETLDANAAASLEVVFDPAAHGPAGVGKVMREIFAESKEGEQFKFSFTAEVTP